MYHLTVNGPARCSQHLASCASPAKAHFLTVERATDAFHRSSTATATLAHKPNLKSYLQASAVTQTAFHQKEIILSDVDGTLVKGSLVLDHAVWLHDAGAVNLKKYTKNWLADPKSEVHISALAEAYRMAIVGMTLKDLGVRPFLQELLALDNKFYSVLERLKTARHAGAEVMLISGSPQFILSPFAKHFGFTAIGSIYHRDKARRFTGDATGMFGAQAKQRVVEKLQLEKFSKVSAYGDTASDIPLLQAAHHSVLVAPSAETLASYPHAHEVVTH